jgi:hypothetical protein
LINEWLRRIPDFEIDPRYSPSYHDIVFDGGTYVLQSLPLRWGVRQT